MRMKKLSVFIHSYGCTYGSILLNLGMLERNTSIKNRCSTSKFILNIAITEIVNKLLSFCVMCNRIVHRGWWQCFMRFWEARATHTHLYTQTHAITFFFVVCSISQRERCCHECCAHEIKRSVSLIYNTHFAFFCNKYNTIQSFFWPLKFIFDKRATTFVLTQFLSGRFDFPKIYGENVRY